MLIPYHNFYEAELHNMPIIKNNKIDLLCKIKRFNHIEHNLFKKTIDKYGKEIMEINRNLLKILLEHVKDKTPLLTHNTNMI